MRKIITILVSASLLAAPAIILAQEEPPGPFEMPEWEDVDIMEVLNNITNWLFAGLLIIAAIAIIIAAYFFVTAAGDPEKTKTARNFVLYAVIGVVVAFVARGLIWLVQRIVVG